jgi:protein-L-isoaspartate(D-aspartate) O-methyltransferase
MRLRLPTAAGLLLVILVALARAGEPVEGGGAADSAEEPNYAERRRQMVEQQLKSRDITDARVLRAMQKVPRHLFVPEGMRPFAYADTALPIGEGQTISQPYIVALMTQLAKPSVNSRALDVGTGSGYQAAVLGELCKQVYGIEIVESLAASSKKRLKQLGYQNIEVRHGDGYRGWKEHAPFDLIVLAAAPDHVPKPLTEQLAVGGRLVLPVGRYFQSLDVIEKQRDGSLKRWTVTFVRFVPMTGEAEEKGQSTKGEGQSTKEEGRSTKDEVRSTKDDERRVRGDEGG